jgi:hypothetical protein
MWGTYYARQNKVWTWSTLRKLFGISEISGFALRGKKQESRQEDQKLIRRRFGEMYGNPDRFNQTVLRVFRDAAL